MDLKAEAQRFGLSIDASPFETYYELLTDWNQRMNLTAITDREEVYEKHFLDSLSGASVFSVSDGMRITDVGSGAGFPGMVLAIAFPEAQVTLIEATGKKTLFLNEVISALHLQNVTVVTGRGEDLAHDPLYREQSDLVTFRAVAALPMLLELGAGFLRPGGSVAAYKGPGFEEEYQTTGHAMKVLDFSLMKKSTFDLAGTSRTIAVFQKHRHTRDTYPRTWNKIKNQRL